MASAPGLENVHSGGRPEGYGGNERETHGAVDQSAEYRRQHAQAQGFLRQRTGSSRRAPSPEVHPHIQEQIAWLKEELNGPDAGLRQKIWQSPVWREKDDLLRSVPGVGEQVSLTLLAELPELGALGPEVD